MKFGMHPAIELQRVERDLRDNTLKYHYLVVDARLRNRLLTWLWSLTASLRALLAPRPFLREERGV